VDRDSTADITQIDRAGDVGTDEIAEDPIVLRHPDIRDEDPGPVQGRREQIAGSGHRSPDRVVRTVVDANAGPAVAESDSTGEIGPAVVAFDDVR